MAKLDEHPTAARHRQRHEGVEAFGGRAERLRRFCLEPGADDVGSVRLTVAEVDDQRSEILSSFPLTRTLVGSL